MPWLKRRPSARQLLTDILTRLSANPSSRPEPLNPQPSRKRTAKDVMVVGRERRLVLQYRERLRGDDISPGPLTSPTPPETPLEAPATVTGGFLPVPSTPGPKPPS